MMYYIVLVPGDGIGPEIVEGAVSVLRCRWGAKYGHTFSL